MASRSAIPLYPLSVRFALGISTVAAAAGTVTWALGGSVAWALALVAGWTALVAPKLGLHGYDRLGPANHVTLLRGAVSAVVAGYVVSPPHGWLLPVLASAALGLDWLDGEVARRAGLASPFGALLDQELDALFVLLLGALCWRSGQVGPWILAAGAYRYAFLLAGAVLPWMRAELPPRRSRAWVCGWVIAAMLTALVPVVSAGVATGLCAAALAGLTWSFAIDVVALGRLS